MSVLESNDLVISDIHLIGNPVTKQVLLVFDAQGLGTNAILLEGAEMQVITDDGIIEFWKTEIQKERSP